MEQLVLVQATKERNGIVIRKSKNNINSCEMRKISLSGRDNGYISSINLSGAVVPQGLSWRGKIANSPIPMEDVFEIVQENMDKITKIIKQ